MKFSALLDVSMVAHETGDEVAVLLHLEAPAVVSAEERPASSIQIVLDRSGSMHGEPLAAATKALTELVNRLDPRDNFGLVAFETEAQVVVPAGPVADKAAIIAAIRSVDSGGSTDLGAGYLRGIQELRRVARESGGTVLIVSDGHINAGLTDVDQFAQLATSAYDKGIVTSTIGYGTGYDETLLVTMARSGLGNHELALNPEDAIAKIAAEVDGLLSKSIQAASLIVTFSPEVELLRLYNDLPAVQLGQDEVMIELGDFYAEEQRKLLLKFKVPALSSLGLTTIASLALTYVELPALVEQNVTLPIAVNVVPGDEAAGRVPNPTVRTEVLFQEAQVAKREASEALEAGDIEGAQKLLSDAVSRLEAAGLEAPVELRRDIDADILEISGTTSMLMATGDANLGSKMTRSSYYRRNSKRGRTEPPA